MNWAIALVSFVLLAILQKRSKPKFLWIICVVLALFGSAAFATTGLGAWVVAAFSTVLGWIGGWFGASPTAIAGAIVLIAVVIAVLDILVDRRADKAAISALIMLPLFAMIASGPISDAVKSFYGSAGSAGASAIGSLIGGG